MHLHRSQMPTTTIIDADNCQQWLAWFLCSELKVVFQYRLVYSFLKIFLCFKLLLDIQILIIGNHTQRIKGRSTRSSPRTSTLLISPTRYSNQIFIGKFIFILVGVNYKENFVRNNNITMRTIVLGITSSSLQAISTMSRKSLALWSLSIQIFYSPSTTFFLTKITQKRVMCNLFNLHNSLLASEITFIGRSEWVNARWITISV